MQNTRPHTPEREIAFGYILPDGEKIIFYVDEFDEKIETVE